MLPLVTIVGAPNVGKSTLFNRLVGHRRAIVTDEPGVTRDRLYGFVRGVPRPFNLVDTAGLTPNTDIPFAKEVERQAEAALEQAAVALFVVDARAGATALDQELAAMLRRRATRCLLVANKVDSDKQDPLIHDLHRLGMGRPIAVSSEHGRGVEALLDEVNTLLSGEPAPDPSTGAEPYALRVAIVGRPNVGKSSIVNRFLGEERVLVSEIPGTTRDAVDTLLELEDRRFLLIDTAGLRRPGKIRRRVERHSVERTRRNIERCDVALLVLDASEDLAAMDAHIAGYVLDAFKPMVVVVNKWDLLDEREAAAKSWEEAVRYRLRFAKQVPLVFISAKTGQRVPGVLDRVVRVHEAAGIQVPTQELNRWLQAHPAAGAMPSAGDLRLFYATQTGVHPPSFVLFCNDPAKVHFSVRRHLENGLRDRFGFGPAPIKLRFRGRREERKP